MSRTYPVNEKGGPVRSNAGTAMQARQTRGHVERLTSGRKHNAPPPPQACAPPGRAPRGTRDPELDSRARRPLASRAQGGLGAAGSHFRAGGLLAGTSAVTSPADKPPPEPERGDPVRRRIALVFAVAAAVCLLAAGILSDHQLHLGWRPPVIAAGAAIVCAGAGLAVLAFGGRPQ